MSGKRLRRRSPAPLFAAAAACAAALAVLLLIWAGSGTGPARSPSEQGSGTSAQKQPQVLRGTVADATMETLQVASADGAVYNFSRGGEEISTGPGGILVGCPVTVTFLGDLDPLQAAQAVTVLSIVVGEPPSEPESAPGPEDGDDPDAAAREILAGMSLEEKVGQMFIARCPRSDGAQLAAEYHLGGYLLFSRDFAGKTPEQAAQAIAGYQQAVSIPMLMGVDEEGGGVVRVSKYSAFRAEAFPSPQELFRSGGLEAVTSDAVEKCRLLRSLGINVNLAPVCDVSQNPADFIYPRTLGLDAGQTAQYVEAVVRAMAGEGMGCVLKHFPGYGGSADTHTGIAYDSRPYESFLTADFLPFQAGIGAGAGIVLVSHNIVECMDAQRPASLSPQVHQILRDELGFSGVIMTDDLVMDGIRDFAGDEQAAVLAVQAGNDLLCSTDFQVQIPAVVEAAARGEISEDRIDQSVLRILKLKLSLGLLAPEGEGGEI